MSLSPREHQILGRMAEELTGSDPGLASLVTGFNRLAAGEEMPPRPRLRSTGRSRREMEMRYRRGSRHSVRASWFFAASWFLATAGMIAVALVLNVIGPGADGNRGCAQPRSVSCTGSGLGALSVPSSGSRS